MKVIFLILSFVCSTWSIDYIEGDIHSIDYKWLNLNLYRGDGQRGGFRKFDDTYLEFEFGGRSGIIDFYGYSDFLDIGDDEKNSDQHNGDNSFSKFDLRFSFDAMLKKNLAWGAVKEWYFATTTTDADYGSFGGLRVYWFGLGTDTLIPWLGLVGLNFQARYFAENYGANNEGNIDGYVLHMNWFKPFYFFKQSGFLAFQGYFDYEFDSEIKGSQRSPTAFQSYLGFWYHLKNYAFGYGAKVYRNMSNYRNGEPLSTGSSTLVNSSGIGHYLNVTYKF